jgi:putative endonuclease
MEIIYVYALVSESDGIIYVGISNDLKRRIDEHNSGKSKFTKGHMPWKIFHYEQAEDYKTARLKEKYFKTSAGKRRLTAILNSQNCVLGSLPD